METRVVMIEMMRWKMGAIGNLVFFFSLFSASEGYHLAPLRHLVVVFASIEVFCLGITDQGGFSTIDVMIRRLLIMRNLNFFFLLLVVSLVPLKVCGCVEMIGCDVQ
jgi:hypothetical protein